MQTYTYKKNVINACLISFHTPQHDYYANILTYMLIEHLW